MDQWDKKCEIREQENAFAQRLMAIRAKQAATQRNLLDTDWLRTLQIAWTADQLKPDTQILIMLIGRSTKDIYFDIKI